MSSFADPRPAPAVAEHLPGARDDRDLATALGIPRALRFASVGSTMDVAHRLAGDGAAPGTLVVAERQDAGRGRSGKSWTSAPGAGVWLTLLERPSDPRAVDVLSLRLGLSLAAALDAFAGETVRLKWPNDLYVGRGKLGGVLVEARWRDGRPEWVAIGVGINLVVPADVPNAAGLPSVAQHGDVLRMLVPAIRAAAAARGVLTGAELQAYAARDLAVGRAIVEPVAGVVAGIAPGGELVVRSSGSQESLLRHGSLVFAEAAGVA